MPHQRIRQIDLMKLLCSFFVVTIHIVMSYRRQDGIIAEHVLLGESFVRCCVPVFFMCSGYLMFSKNHTIKSMYRKLLYNLIFPTLTVVFFLFVFNNFVENKSTILDCIQNISPDAFLALIKELLNWNIYCINNTFYLWFMLSLIKIYIAYPVLKLLCVDSKERNTTRRLIMVLCIVSDFVFPTIQSLFNNQITLYGYSIFCDYSFLYIFLGYELYLLFQRKEIRKEWSLYGLLIYISGSLITYFFTIFFDVRYDNIFDEYFFNYNTLGVLISALGFFVFIRNISVPDNKVTDIMTFCSQRTFTLYLVHYIIIRIMVCYGVINLLDARLPRPLFYLVSVSLCYCLSLGLSITLYRVKIILKKFIHA